MGPVVAQERAEDGGCGFGDATPNHTAAGSLFPEAPVGAVHTPIHQRAGELNIPSTSYYQNLRDHINEVREGTTKPGAVDTDTVCKALIADITGGKSGVIWRGGTASAVRLLSWISPSSVWDSIVNNGRGLDQVVRPSDKS